MPENRQSKELPKMVSVIVAAYDAAPIIRRAVDSAINQTVPPHEIIIIDDASRDNTREVVEDLSRENSLIKIVSLEKNGGPARARNVGISKATGDWVAILDADDAWRPQRLERLIAIANEYQADFVADNQIYYDSYAGKEGSIGFNVDWKCKAISVEDFFLNDIIEVVPFSYGNLQPILRREFLLKSGLRYDEQVRFGEDFKLYAEMLFNNATAVVTSDAYYIHSTRVGEFSRKRAPHSKTDSRFDVLMQASDDLRAKYHDKITPGLARAMDLRQRQLRLIQ